MTNAEAANSLFQLDDEDSVEKYISDIKKQEEATEPKQVSKASRLSEPSGSPSVNITQVGPKGNLEHLMKVSKETSVFLFYRSRP